MSDKIQQWVVISFQKNSSIFGSYFSGVKAALKKEKDSSWIDSKTLIELCTEIEFPFQFMNDGYISFTVVNNSEIDNYLESKTSENLGIYDAFNFRELLHFGNLDLTYRIRDYEELGKERLAERLRDKVLGNYKLYLFLNDYKKKYSEESLKELSVSIDISYNLPFF